MCFMYAEMVPLFERGGNELVQYWKESLDDDGTAVKPINADLSRTVCVVYTGWAKKPDRF